MSAQDSNSDLSKTFSDDNVSENSSRTVSNAVNTEELLASLSLLNLSASDEPEDTGSKTETSENRESHAPTPVLSQEKSSEPMQVIGKDQHLNQLFNRVQSLLKGDADQSPDQFIPQCPETVEDTGLIQDDFERLILKYLLAKGTRTGRQICQQIKLPFGIVDPILKRAKQDQLVAFRGTAEMGDYEFTITDLGRERARRFAQECTYFGSAPVCFKDYLNAMEAQSIAKQEATEEDLKEAFSDLIINSKMLDRLGPAVNSGRGMFLFGEAGNGKTSIAERITKAFGSTIWIPRCLSIDGDIVRIFDHAYACLSHRTNDVILNDWATQLGYKVVSFHATQEIDGEFLPIYHTNVMMSVGQEIAILCADSVRNESERNELIKSLEKTGKEIVFISEAQTNQFAGNMLQIVTGAGEKLMVMSTQAYESLNDEQIATIEKTNRILHSQLNTIETLGGGSARCMMAEVFLPDG